MTSDEIKDAVKDALKEELGEFNISREIHYEDHKFIGALREWMGEIKATAVKTIVRGAISIVFILIFLGFVFWGKGHFK